MKKTVLFSVGLSALVIAVGSVAVVSSGVADPPAEKDYSGLKPIQTSIIDDSADRIEMINKLIELGLIAQVNKTTYYKLW